MKRQYSFLDQFIFQIDNAITTISSSNRASRKSPAKKITEENLQEDEKKAASRLMRVNHTGEVCAQALYQAQSLTSKKKETKHYMSHAGKEEIDHLAWCEDRLKELNSNPSILNPIFYLLSFKIGATTGLISDRLSLGFVAATEELVCEHLKEHLQKIPQNDLKSKAIIEKMIADEEQHAISAIQEGGIPFPNIVKKSMKLISKTMTKTSYYI